MTNEIRGEIQMPFHGESAYEIARKYGYEGTEKEWLDTLGFIPDGTIGKEKLNEALSEIVDGKVDFDYLCTSETVLVPAKEASANILNPADEVSGKNVYVSGNAFALAGGDAYSYVVVPVTAGHSYKVVGKDGASVYTSYTFYWAKGDDNQINNLTYLSTQGGMWGILNENEEYIATAPDEANYIVFNNKFKHPMIYDYTENGLLTEYVEYSPAEEGYEKTISVIKDDFIPTLEEIKGQHSADIEEMDVKFLNLVNDTQEKLNELDKDIEEALTRGLVTSDELFEYETITIEAQEASANILNPADEVSGKNVYISSTTGNFGLAPGDAYSYIVMPVSGGHNYKMVSENCYNSYVFYWAKGESSNIGDLTYLSTSQNMFANLSEDETYIATAPDEANYLVFNNRLAYPMIYDYTQHGLLTEYVDYSPEIEEHEEVLKTVRGEFIPAIERLKEKHGEDVAQLTENVEILQNKTGDSRVWEDCENLCNWVAGYAWFIDNNAVGGVAYRQATESETINSASAYNNVSAIPPQAPIEVHAGEQWHTTTHPYIGNKAKSIIICDENDNVIWTQPNTSKPAEGIYFTIPEGGAKMYFTFQNDNTFSLKKLVNREISKTESSIEDLKKKMIKRNMENHYKIYRRNRPILNENDKAYVMFTIDDCRKDMDVVADVFEEYDVPLCIAAIPDLFKNCASQGEETRLEVCQRVVNNGGEILAHSGTVLTSENFGFDVKYNQFCTIKEKLESYGFDVNGIILAGGTGYGTIDFAEAEKWSSYFYEYSDLYGLEEPYKHQRKSLYQKDLEYFKRQVNNAIENKEMVSFFFHDTNELDLDTLRSMLEYVKSLSEEDVEVVTYKEYYDKALS